MHFLGVQASVAHEFAGQHQHRNLVAEAFARGGILIDIHNVDRAASCLGNGLQLPQHLIA